MIDNPPGQNVSDTDISSSRTDDRPPLSVAAMASGMKPWLSQSWREAIHHWSPFLHAATVHADDHKRHRMSAACQTALREKAWDVALDLLPHASAHWSGRLGYALLRARPDLTWETLSKIHMSQRSENHSLLATAIMFEAAERLDGDMVEAMLRRGATLKGQDDQVHTVVGRVADQAHTRFQGEADLARALMERWLKAQPRVSWSKADIARMVQTEDPEWMLRVLGPRPLLSHLYRALPQATAKGHTTLIQAWMPHVVAQARGAKSSSAAQQFMRNVVREAVAEGLDPDTLRWIVDQAMVSAVAFRGSDDGSLPLQGLAQHGRALAPRTPQRDVVVGHPSGQARQRHPRLDGDPLTPAFARCVHRPLWRGCATFGQRPPAS